MPPEYITLIGIGVQTLLYLLAGYAMIIRADGTAMNLKQEVHEMKEELKSLADVITIQAVQTNRLDTLASQLSSIERRVEDMRRLKGFVTNRPVDGEYGP